MINIAFVIDKIESPTAGTEKQLLLLIKHLDRSKFTPYLCVLKTSKWLLEEFRDCYLFCADIDSFKKPSGCAGIWRLRNFLLKKRIDVIQVHFRDGNIAGIIGARLAGIRKIIGTRRNQGYWMNRKELIIQKFLNRFVTTFIANSESTKEWVEKTENISPERIHVIYNGIDLEPFSRINIGMQERMRGELGIPQDAKVAGIVANLRPVKAIDVFLTAAALIKKQIDNAHFVIVGDGPDRVHLQSLAHHLKINECVHFLGKQTNIPYILSAFDVGVLSSNSESFSNSIIEYLAAGLPIVCTNVGGVYEVISDNGCGLIVPAKNVLKLSDSIIYSILHKTNFDSFKAKKWLSENCSFEIVSLKHMKLYNHLLRNCGYH